MKKLPYKITFENNKIYYGKRSNSRHEYFHSDGYFGDNYSAINSLFKELYSDKISDLVRDSLIYGTAKVRITK